MIDTVTTAFVASTFTARHSYLLYFRVAVQLLPLFIVPFSPPSLPHFPMSISPSLTDCAFLR